MIVHGSCFQYTFISFKPHITIQWLLYFSAYYEINRNWEVSYNLSSVLQLSVRGRAWIWVTNYISHGLNDILSLGNKGEIIKHRFPHKEELDKESQENKDIQISFQPISSNGHHSGQLAQVLTRLGSRKTLSEKKEIQAKLCCLIPTTYNSPSMKKE